MKMYVATVVMSARKVAKTVTDCQLHLNHGQLKALYGRGEYWNYESDERTAAEQAQKLRKMINEEIRPRQGDAGSAM